MRISRRDFVQLGLAGVLTANNGPVAAAARLYGEIPSRPLDILILGGTRFIGPHMVREAQSRGHTVTLFNRGKTNPDLFSDIETLIGDRDGNLQALEGRRWDVVIDTSGYLPRLVGDSARLLTNAVEHYLFISSMAVYASFTTRFMDETGPLRIMPDTESEEVNEYYGALKVLCEQVVQETLPGRNTILRPGIIAGPGDHTDRFNYWPVRVSRGGHMLAPGNGSDFMQWVDVRDLAQFVIRCLERNITGIYNAVRPAAAYTMGDMIEDSRVISGVKDLEVEWIPLEFLQQHGVEPWDDLPAYMPLSPPGDFSHMFAISSAAAFTKGLRARAATATIADILAWWQTLPEERRNPMRAGLSVEKEAEVLAAWAKEKS